MADHADNISAGTQVVSLAEVRGTNNSLVHPRGADTVAAEKTGRTLMSVQIKRRKLGLPPREASRPAERPHKLHGSAQIFPTRIYETYAPAQHRDTETHRDSTTPGR